MNTESFQINKRITEIRIKKGMNQAELSSKAHITPAAISQIEKGDRTPSLPVLQRIAEVLGVSMDFLAGRTSTSLVEDVLQHESTLSFLSGFQGLSDSDQATIIKNIDFLRTQAEELKGRGR